MAVVHLLFIAAAVINSDAQHVVLDGNATVKIFTNVLGTAISYLKSAPGFPDAPNAIKTVKFIEYPNGSDDGRVPATDFSYDYGAIISGFLIVDLTDNYVFWLSSATMVSFG